MLYVFLRYEYDRSSYSYEEFNELDRLYNVYIQNHVNFFGAHSHISVSVKRHQKLSKHELYNAAIDGLGGKIRDEVQESKHTIVTKFRRSLMAIHEDIKRIKKLVDLNQVLESEPYLKQHIEAQNETPQKVIKITSKFSMNNFFGLCVVCVKQKLVSF